MRQISNPNEDSLSCSFCGKSEKKAGKLISSPSARPRAYICDECVTVCAAIIEDDKIEAESVQPPHPFLAHPLASGLMQAVERWVLDQSLGNDGSGALAEMRRIARSMVGD